MEVFLWHDVWKREADNTNINTSNIAMLFNYIKISFRKFTRQKFYSLLNIFGLATGMATVILIMLYVLDELSYDKFHTHEKDL